MPSLSSLPSPQARPPMPEQPVDAPPCSQHGLPCLHHGMHLATPAEAKGPTFSQVFTLTDEAKSGRFKKRPRRPPQKQPMSAQMLARKLLQGFTKRWRASQCCKQKCVHHALGDRAYMQEVVKWHEKWQMLGRTTKAQALLEHEQVGRIQSQNPTAEVGHDLTKTGISKMALAGSVGKREACSYTFLGRSSLCSRAFQRLTGTHLRHTRKRLALGVQQVERQQRKYPSPRHDEMYAAVWMLIRNLHSQSPFAKAQEPGPADGVWRIPFHMKVCLWRLVQQWHARRASQADKPPMFTKPPKYSTFRKIMVMKEMREHVVFHRVVDIGRCALCNYIQWKCSAVERALQPVWQGALAKHQWLAIQQKRCYARDRAVAASDYPHTEIYMAHVFRCWV